MIFLQGFIKFDQGISEKCVGQTFDGRKKERKRIIIIRNGANTICLPNFAWGAIITTLIDMSTPDLLMSLRIDKWFVEIFKLLLIDTIDTVTICLFDIKFISIH